MFPLNNIGRHIIDVHGSNDIRAYSKVALADQESRTISEENHDHDAIIIPVEPEMRSSNERPKLSRPVSRVPNFGPEKIPDVSFDFLNYNFKKNLV